jgi:hypothetical protein
MDLLARAPLATLVPCFFNISRALGGCACDIELTVGSRNIGRGGHI